MNRFGGLYSDEMLRIPENNYKIFEAPLDIFPISFHLICKSHPFIYILNKKCYLYSILLEKVLENIFKRAYYVINDINNSFCGDYIKEIIFYVAK